MKLLSLVSLFFLTSSAWALTWGDLELGRGYSLAPKVQLKPGLSLRPGSRLKWVDQTTLDQIQVVIFQFKLIDCTGSIANQKSEIVIVQKKYGVELEPSCLLNVYVELKDFYQPSLVKPLSVDK